ncbi:unnamed protein product [Caenorhabditis angaria]|uniref:Uncharacterized protein n=1 Tax=Caenorhabditis angaria TaxID=860376 RepID=A0A9P1N7M0_9PELO|nr:unnamed protein product [Caenorhabditis angaria]
MNLKISLFSNHPKYPIDEPSSHAALVRDIDFALYTLKRVAYRFIRAIEDTSIMRNNILDNLETKIDLMKTEQLMPEENSVAYRFDC